MTPPFIPVNIDKLSKNLNGLIQEHEKLIIMLKCKNENLEQDQKTIEESVKEFFLDYGDVFKFEIVDAESSVPLSEVYPEWKTSVDRTEPLFLFYASHRLDSTYEGHNYETIKREILKLLGDRQNHWMANKAHEQGTRSVSFMSNDTVCSGGEDGLVKVWSFASDQLKEQFCWGDHEPSNVASLAEFNGYLWSSDFHGVALRHCVERPADEVIRLIDPECIMQEGFENTTHAHDKVISTIKIAPRLFNHECPCVLTGAWDGTLKIWDHNTGCLLETYRNHKHAVTMESLRGGEYLVTGCQSGYLKLWDNTGLVQELKAHDDIIREILSIDDSTIATCSNDNLVKGFRITNGKLVQDKSLGFECPSFIYSFAAFHHLKHGTVIATGCEGGLFSVRPLKFDKNLGRVFGEIDFSKATPRCIRISKDGRFIAIANDGGLLSVWDSEFLIGSGVQPTGENEIQNSTTEEAKEDSNVLPQKPTSMFPILDHQKYDSLNSLIKLNDLPTHWDTIRSKALNETERFTFNDIEEVISDIEKKAISFEKLDVLRGVIWSRRGDLVRILEDNLEVHATMCQDLVNVIYSSEEFDAKIRVLAMRCLINLFSIKSADVERTVFLKIVHRLLTPLPELYSSKLLYTTMSAMIFNISVSSLGCSGCSTHSRRGVLVDMINNMMAYSKVMGYPAFAETNLLFSVGNFINSKAYGIEEFGNLDDVQDEQGICGEVKMQ